MKHGRQDSNLQPAVLETAALPIELRPLIIVNGQLVNSYGSLMKRTSLTTSY